MFLGGGVVAEVEALSAVPVSVCGSLCIDCESGVAHGWESVLGLVRADIGFVTAVVLRLWNGISATVTTFF